MTQVRPGTVITRSPTDSSTLTVTCYDRCIIIPCADKCVCALFVERLPADVTAVQVSCKTLNRVWMVPEGVKSFTLTAKAVTDQFRLAGTFTSLSLTLQSPMIIWPDTFPDTVKDLDLTGPEFNLQLGLRVNRFALNGSLKNQSRLSVRDRFQYVGAAAKQVLIDYREAIPHVAKFSSDTPPERLLSASHVETTITPSTLDDVLRGLRPTVKALTLWMMSDMLAIHRLGRIRVPDSTTSLAIHSPKNPLVYAQCPPQIRHLLLNDVTMELFPDNLDSFTLMTRDTSPDISQAGYVPVLEVYLFPKASHDDFILDMSGCQTKHLTLWAYEGNAGVRQSTVRIVNIPTSLETIRFEKRQ